MLFLINLLAYQASLATANFIVRGPSDNPLPSPPVYNRGVSKLNTRNNHGLSRRGSTWLQRRTDMNEKGSKNIMAGDQYKPGKIMVKPGEARWNGSSWVAMVNVTGSSYMMAIDGSISDTWLFSPEDKFRCEWEELVMGDAYCYQKNGETKFLNPAEPFLVNHTGSEVVGMISGRQAILNTISASKNMENCASWPAVIELAENIYPLDANRYFHGVLGLSKKDMGKAFKQNPATPTGAPGSLQYPLTPFHDVSKWTYFTTNFNLMGPKDNLYIGMQYMDSSVHQGELKALKTNPMSDLWAFDASPAWKGKITANMTGIDLPIPLMFPKLSNYTETVVLDLQSDLTYVDLENARNIYLALGGSCEFVEGAGPKVSYCTFPVTISYDMAKKDYVVIPDKPATVELPWAPGSSIKLDPMSLAYRLVEHPSGCLSTNLTETIGCHTKVLGMIQPSLGDYWIYGSVVFANAFFKWDTANGGEVSMAPYADQGMKGVPRAIVDMIPHM